MKNLGILVMATLVSLLNPACSGTSLKPSLGVVIKYEIMPGSAEKHGIKAVTDEGKQIFGHAGLRAPEILGRSGGTLSYIGAGIPKWIRVTWQTPIYGKLTTSTGKVVDTLDFGEIVGDYTLQIANRIPPEVLKYASQGEDRAIRLIFRLKDDGVLLAWDVQEWYGGLWAYSLHGGDFPCDPVSPHASRPTCTSGYLKDAPWYHP